VRYREIPAPAELSHFVECFWTLESDGAARVAQRVVPDGHCELILNSGRPFEAFQGGGWHAQPRLFLAGQIEGPLLLRPAGPARILGVRFHPHGAAAVFGPRMPEFSGQFVNVADLSSALSRDLGDALESGDAVASVAEALRRAQPRIPAPDRLVGHAVTHLVRHPASDVASVARAFGLSVRQFERRFRAEVGLPPKLFGRLRRFLRVFRAMEQANATWVETAFACGYYDQAHLIRDFRRFSGQTPAVLLARDADLARHFLMSHSYNTAALEPCKLVE
jgi:AraC-like DNA-binding protein